MSYQQNTLFTGRHNPIPGSLAPFRAALFVSAQNESSLFSAHEMSKGRNKLLQVRPSKKSKSRVDGGTYRLVQLDLTPEIEVFHMQFQRCLT